MADSEKKVIYCSMKCGGVVGLGKPPADDAAAERFCVACLSRIDPFAESALRGILSAGVPKDARSEDIAKAAFILGIAMLKVRFTLQNGVV